jgi:hypothetical protein
MQKAHTQSSSIIKIKQKLGYLKVHSLAKKNKVTRRANRKCSVVDILLSYWILISRNKFSYDSWAIQISNLTGKTISGQAVWKRITPKMVCFIKLLLEKSLKQKYASFMDSELFKSFENVYLQDATHFSIPRILSKSFPGSFSKYGDIATAKIQAVFNLKCGNFSNFTLNSYRDNDQKDSPRIVKQLKEGDLLIRDLGYFVLSVFKTITKKKAYFLSRFKFNVNVYDLKSGDKIDLNKLLKNKKRLDLEVYLGANEKFKCRLIAMALPEQKASQRIRKEKNNRSKKTNHSKSYLQLLKYSIYITNVPKQVWKPKDVLQAYKSRWYIEILFKSWKSNLNMKNNIPDRYISVQRVEFYIYASLLMVTLLVMPIFILLEYQRKKKKLAISILKLCEYINQNIALIINMGINKIIEQIEYYCCYESRRNRINAIETMYITIS